jgi:hypothetical protein
MKKVTSNTKKKLNTSLCNSILSSLANNDNSKFISIIQICDTIEPLNFNIISHSIAVVLIFAYSVIFKRRLFFLNICDSRPGLLSIPSSFKKYDRTATAFLYGIMVYQVMSIINSSLNNTTPVEISDVAQQDPIGLFKLFI